MHVSRNIEAIRAAIVVLENNEYYVLLVCVRILVIQHAMRMRHIVICGLPSCTIFSPHYLINGTLFRKK